MYDRLDKNFFSIVQKYEYDVKVSRTRTFVRGQRRTKVRPCGRTFRGRWFIQKLLEVHFTRIMNTISLKKFAKKIYQNNYYTKTAKPILITFLFLHYH